MKNFRFYKDLTYYFWLKRLIKSIILVELTVWYSLKKIFFTISALKKIKFLSFNKFRNNLNIYIIIYIYVILKICVFICSIWPPFFSVPRYYKNSRQVFLDSVRPEECPSKKIVKKWSVAELPTKNDPTNAFSMGKFSLFV